jgi:hypothetical protein
MTGDPAIVAGSCDTATEAAQYISIKYTERLAQTGLRAAMDEGRTDGLVFFVFDLLWFALIFGRNSDTLLRGERHGHSAISRIAAAIVEAHGGRRGAPLAAYFASRRT